MREMARTLDGSIVKDREMVAMTVTYEVAFGGLSQSKCRLQLSLKETPYPDIILRTIKI